MPASWFTITNKASLETAEIEISDVIGRYGISAAAFRDQLRALHGTGTVKQIVLSIDCPGGSCEDGFTIYDAIKATKVPVTAHIVGTAASMASVIMLAADLITIAENGRVMVHRVTAGAEGNADDLDAAAKVARQFEDRIVSLYVERTGKAESKVRDWMKAQMGTWFFGAQAIEAGFADAILPAAKASAFKPEWASMFTMLPSALFDSNSNPNLQPTHMTEAQVQTIVAAAIAAALADFKPNAKSNEDLETLQTLLKDEVPNKLKALLPDALKDLTGKVEAAATTKSVTDLQAKIESLETLIKSGIPSAAGGRPPVKGAGAGEGNPGSEGKTILEQYKEITEPAASAKFFKEHKAELYDAFQAKKKTENIAA